jgi:predicted hotdog family 3-hydroxylacyl-ACP dehydratase
MMTATFPVENIQPLIPQAPPFVMIDAIVKSEATLTRSTLKIKAENIFVENGLFREPGLLENIAQTAAAGVGFEAQKENRPAPIGYIGAVKNFEVFSLPKVGSTVETEIFVSNRIFDVTVITGKVWYDNILLAQCEMKIFVQPDIPAKA